MSVIYAHSIALLSVLHYTEQNFMVDNVQL
jgi:hypothetical protein